MRTKTVEIEGQQFTFAMPYLFFVRQFEELMRDLVAKKPVKEEEAERVTVDLILSGMNRVAPTSKEDLERRLDGDGLQQLVKAVSQFAGLVPVSPGEAASP